MSVWWGVLKGEGVGVSRVGFTWGVGNFGLFGDGGFRIISSVFIKMSQLLLLHFQILSFKT